jgi:hypothetical protein
MLTDPTRILGRYIQFLLACQFHSNAWRVTQMPPKRAPRSGPSPENWITWNKGFPKPGEANRCEAHNTAKNRSSQSRSKASGVDAGRVAPLARGRRPDLLAPEGEERWDGRRTDNRALKRLAFQKFGSAPWDFEHPRIM